MKSRNLQYLIKTIFSNEDIRQEFVSNPNKVISQYKLTNQEKMALLTSHTKFGLITSDNQQIDKIEPLTNWW